MTRHYRDLLYEIEVRNPDHACKGVVSLCVDGRDISGSMVPIFQGGLKHRVEAVLGEKGDNR